MFKKKKAHYNQVAENQKERENLNSIQRQNKHYMPRNRNKYFPDFLSETT